MRSCELQLTETAPAGILADGDDFIRSRIFSVRGVQVMLDSDLAKIYQVETRVFNQSVKRNESRLPPNFRFRLSMEEYRSLISQIVTSKEAQGATLVEPFYQPSEFIKQTSRETTRTTGKPKRRS